MENFEKLRDLIGTFFLQCKAKEPFRPARGGLPFLVYFPSRYRGLCCGTLISRVAVITAAVCVTNPVADLPDQRSINVVTGSTYRHARRGIRVQVTKILIPNVAKYGSANRGYLMSKSPAILLLKRKIPDVLAEVPLRALELDWKGEEALTLQEECFMPGWHFFYQGDQIFPVNKFLLQRNVRVQFLNLVKLNLWCDSLTMKFQKALSNMGFMGHFDKAGLLCVRDGMYGSPLICRGKAIGMMMAPDAQWSNCTGFSNVIHIFSSKYLAPMMACISSLFEVEDKVSWTMMKKSLYDDSTADVYDYMPALYDKLTDYEVDDEDDAAATKATCSGETVQQQTNKKQSTTTVKSTSKCSKEE